MFLAAFSAVQLAPPVPKYVLSIKYAVLVVVGSV